MASLTGGTTATKGGGGQDGLQIETNGGSKRLNKSTSQPTVQNKRTLAPLKSKSSKDLLAHTQGSRASVAEKSPGKRNSTAQSEDDDQQSLTAAARAKSPGLNDKLFKKMKRDRLGATDARTVSLFLLLSCIANYSRVCHLSIPLPSRCSHLSFSLHPFKTGSFG